MMTTWYDYSGNIYFSMEAMNVTITTSCLHFYFQAAAFTEMPKCVS